MAHDVFQAARESAVLFDLGNRAKIELSGRDACEFLHNLCTQDVKGLPVGETREAFLTTTKARIIAHIWIMRRAADVLLLDFAPGLAGKVLDHLNHYLISERVELADRTDELAMLRIVGPKAPEFAVQIGAKPDRRHHLLGIEGIDVFCPAGDAANLHDRFLRAGAVPGDTATYDVLRIEAGLPEYGIDFDEDRLAMEVNRPEAICYTKGCYLGQETIVMARDRGQLNRRRMGVLGSSALPAGAKVYRGADEVGGITSSTYSTNLGRTIAFAYLRRGSWDAGTEIATAPEAPPVGAVCELPFLKRS